MTATSIVTMVFHGILASFRIISLSYVSGYKDRYQYLVWKVQRIKHSEEYVIIITLIGVDYELFCIMLYITNNKAINDL